MKISTHTLLIAKYCSSYTDCPSYEILGVFDSDISLQSAIKEYKARKYKYNAEILLQDTTFIHKPITINEVMCNGL